MIAATVATALAATPGQPLPGFLAAVGRYLAEYGYWAILALVLVEDFGIPVPGETVLIAGAVEAGTGQLNVILVAVTGFAAAVAGDNIGYAIGRFGGRALVARWGKYILLTEERLGKAEHFFNTHGGKVIVVARFIEGLRQANGIIAGISRMHWLKFFTFNALGAALWVGCWVSAGYFGGQAHRDDLPLRCPVLALRADSPRHRRLGLDTAAHPQAPPGTRRPGSRRRLTLFPRNGPATSPTLPFTPHAPHRPSLGVLGRCPLPVADVTYGPPDSIVVHSRLQLAGLTDSDFGGYNPQSLNQLGYSTTVDPNCRPVWAP